MSVKTRRSNNYYAAEESEKHEYDFESAFQNPLSETTNGAS
jgi:hypothetical protein